MCNEVILYNLRCRNYTKMLQYTFKLQASVMHLEDHHLGTEESKLMSQSTRTTQRLKTHVTHLHLHTNTIQYFITNTLHSQLQAFSDVWISHQSYRAHMGLFVKYYNLLHYTPWVNKRIHQVVVISCYLLIHSNDFLHPSQDPHFKSFQYLNIYMCNEVILYNLRCRNYTKMF